MIHDEICTYEVAKLAKEKGFDWKCREYYNRNFDLRVNGIYALEFTNSQIDEGYVTAPNQSLLQRWLREEKGVIIELKYSDFTEDWRPFWSWCIYNNLGFTLEIGDNPATYELALEDALKYALKHLVL